MKINSIDGREIWPASMIAKALHCSLPTVYAWVDAGVLEGGRLEGGNEPWFAFKDSVLKVRKQQRQALFEKATALSHDLD